jgi:peptide/nickel transport system substrate-binding protein
LARGADGVRFSIRFSHASTQQRLALALREQLKAAGIALALETMDFNAAVDRVFVKKDFDIGMASYCNGADPVIGVRRVYVSSNIGPFPFSNGAGYRNARVDELFEQAARAADRGTRRARYAEIQKILADDVSYFWIIDAEGLRAYRAAFTGFRLWTGAFVETVRESKGKS